MGKTKKAKVVATKDFFVGPYGGTKAVSKGEVFEVLLYDGRVFTIHRDNGSVFGACYVGSGFELVEEDVEEDLVQLRMKAERDLKEGPVSIRKYVTRLEDVLVKMLDGTTRLENAIEELKREVLSSFGRDLKG